MMTGMNCLMKRLSVRSAHVVTRNLSKSTPKMKPFRKQKCRSSSIPFRDQMTDITFVTTFSRHLTITEMEQILHQTKLYLVELEDHPSTAEKLQHHRQLLDHVSRSLRSVQQNHQNLTSEIADLKSKLESEIAKTLILTDDVKDLKETALQQNTKIAQQNTKIAQQNTNIAQQNTKIAQQNTKITELTTRVEYQKYVIAIQDINHLYHLESKVFNLHKLRKQRVEVSHFIDDNDGLDLRNYKASFTLTQFNEMSTPCQDKFRTKFGPNFLTQFSDEVKNIGLVVGFVSDDDIAETAEWWDE
jgi:hypothetical protein